MKFAPHDYEKKGIAAVVSNPCMGLFWDPGLGKTVTMLSAFKILLEQKMARRMLVVTPLRPMYMTWPAEIKKWDHTRHLKCGILHGPMKSSVLNDPDVKIHVINPEGLKWLARTVDDPSDYWDILCVDESTRFKHTDTERFKMLRPMLEKFGRRYILTGSPAPNGLLDLFGQIYILDLGTSLGRYITHYRSNYFSCYDGFNYVPNYGAEGQIYAKLAPLVQRLDARDYLKLPELVGACGFSDEPLIREVELSEDARKVYNKMESYMIAELEQDTVVAVNAASVSNKCRQIANGGLYGSEERKDLGARGVYDLHDAKTDAVEEIVEELQGTPALVAYEYEHDRDRLLRRFGPNTPWIGGGVGAAKFAAIEALWNAGKIPVLLAQPQSVAHGLNLQGTKAAVIWHSITWDLEVYEQFIRRVWRQGQEGRVFVHHVVAKNTIDEVVMGMLKKKDKTQRALLNALKAAYT